MTKDINDYITIIRQKNGDIKIKFDEKKEGNRYRLLRELGYRKAKLDNKYVYFRRVDADIISVTIRDIKDAFLNLLKNNRFENIPDDIEYSSILDSYYQSKAIKENGLLDHCLEEELNENDIHKLRLNIDHNYRLLHEK